MEKEFMEAVMSKLNQIDTITSQLNAIEASIAKLEEMKASIAKLDAMEERSMSRLDAIEASITRLDAIEASITRLDAMEEKSMSRLDEMEENFQKVFAMLEEHGREIRSIKDFLIVKEDELFNKIRALFDGYTASYEKNIDLEFRQNATEEKVGINSIRISMLEDTSKIHTKQISELSAK